MTSPPVPPRLALSPEALQAEVEAHHEARLRRLTAPTGWLSIAAKVWLSEGTHLVGSRPDADVPLPPGAPPVVGWATLRKGAVSFVAEPGVGVFAGGEPVTSVVLRSDVEASPHTLTCGTLTLQLLRRGDDFALRVRDPDAALRRRFPGVPTFPVDPAWRIVAPLARFPAERSVLYQDNDGRPQPYLSPGVVTFTKNGVACQLAPVFETDRKRLFMLFSDATNHDQTYGAGRFLYVPLPDDEADDLLVLDFNKAFNPPCAFTAFASCPLPPPENRLAVRVEAGEKRPTEPAGTTG